MEVELAALASILDARRRRRRRRRRRQPLGLVGRGRERAPCWRSPVQGRKELAARAIRKKQVSIVAIGSAQSSHRARTEGDLPFRLAVPRPEAVTARAQQGLDRLRRRGRQQRSQHVQRATEVWPQVGLCAVSGSGSSAVGARALLAGEGEGGLRPESSTPRSAWSCDWTAVGCTLQAAQGRA